MADKNEPIKPPNDNIGKLQQSIEKIIGVKTKLKKRKKTKDELERDKFVTLIQSIEHVYARSCLTGEVMLDTTKYDEEFYKIIDTLIETSYGKTVADMINFYLYERVEIDGSINELRDENQVLIPLNDASDLYNLICRLKGLDEDEKAK